MATNKVGPTPVLVLDMTSLRFSWTPERTAVAALTHRGEVLSVVDAVPNEPTSQVAYRAMDAALARAVVLRTDTTTSCDVADSPDSIGSTGPPRTTGPPEMVTAAPRSTAGRQVRLRVALYNPFTAEVAYDAVPDTVVFSDGDRLDLPAAGLPAVVDEDGDEPTLTAGDRVLVPRTASVAQLTRLAVTDHD